MLSRRSFLSLAGGSLATLVFTQDLLASGDTSHAMARGTKITVYRSASCGCCADWVSHLAKNGFQVDSRLVEDVDPVKREHNVPEKLWSCHTAIVGSYVIEGHVPADVISLLLAEHPAVAGLAVPGMPMGAPGMEHGDHKAPYDVLSFTCCGDTKVYAKR